MLKNCVALFGHATSKESPPAQKRALSGASISLDISFQFRDVSLSSQLNEVSVRIIHAGGRIELYQDVIPASLVMAKYPGMCVALPEVFKNPHESILPPDEDLLPGRKYYIIPSTTVKKLKHKHQEKLKAKEQPPAAADADAKETKPVEKTKRDAGREFAEEPISSAKDFYTSKERWSKQPTRKKGIRKGPFVPPIPRARSGRSLTWEPSLTSVQELSP